MKRPLLLVLLLILAGFLAWILLQEGSSRREAPQNGLSGRGQVPAREAAPALSGEALPETGRQAPGLSSGGESPAGGRTELGGGPLLLRALQADGRPAAAARFLVRAPGQTRILEGEDGFAKLERREKTQMVAALAGGLWSDPHLLTSVERKAGQEIRLTVRVPAATLLVLARHEDGTPLASFQTDTLFFTPLPGAEPEVDGLARQIAKTLGCAEGADGHLSFPGLYPGVYSVRVSTPAEAPASASVKLLPGSREAVLLKLAPGAFLTGRILAEDGRPLPDAGITAGPNTGLLEGMQEEFLQPREDPPLPGLAVFSGVSGRDGTFRLGPMPAGSFGMVVRIEPFPVFVQPGGVTLVEGQETDLGDIRLPAGLTLQVRVTEEDGTTPIPGARVQFHRGSRDTSILGSLRSWKEPGQPVADPQGRVTIAALPPGPVSLQVGASGHARREVGLQLEKNGQEEVVPLAPDVGIRGMVLDQAGGKPVAGAEILPRPGQDDRRLPGLGGLSGNDSRTAESAEDGTFGFRGLSAGHWTLTVTHPDYADRISEPIRVGPGLPEPEVTLHLSRGATLHILALDGEGNPQPGAVVSTFSFGGSAPKGDSTGPDGRVTFEHLAADTYMVSLLPGLGPDSPEDASRLAQGDLSGFKMTSKTVTLEENQELEVVLGGESDFATLQGYVTRRGEPLEGLNVMIYGEGFSNMQMESTGENGAYEFQDVAPGNYLIFAGKVQFGGGSGWSGSLTVPEGGGIVQHDVELPAASIRVRVLDAGSGEPLAGIPILLRTTGGEQGTGGTSSSDAKGEAVFDFLAPGRYTVAAGQAAMPIFPSGKGRASRMAGPVTISEDQDEEQTVEIRLEKEARLRVTVTDTRGDPVAGAGVFFLDPSGQPLSAFSLKSTDARGIVELGALPPGPGRVLARKEGAGQVETEVRLQSGETTEVPLTLEAGTMVYVQVTDKEGKPATGIQAILLDARGAPLSLLYSGVAAATQAGLSFLKGGEQKIGPVPPGTYSVLLAKPGGGRKTHTVEIPRGTPEMHLTLAFE
ncbi:MAG: collagen binding domain-containing protein, partial [Planctomycetota bacterium]